MWLWIRFCKSSISNISQLYRDKENSKHEELDMSIDNDLDLEKGNDQMQEDKKDRDLESNQLSQSKKIQKLKYDIPQTAFYERRKKPARPFLKEPMVAQSPLKQIPEEALCSNCKNYLIKPFILTCCCASICKFCKISTFDLAILTSCPLCSSENFDIKPNLQAQLAMKSIFGLKPMEMSKTVPKAINKFLLYKSLVSIDHQRKHQNALKST
jgi:hypothetical protein